ncbi:hypothetical protein O3P69_011768 [Scylla paramamosain]|uniref:Ig-like domain-containing protein n=1 Tax=Scylla paramamosain TaxID=85552 RepID=A0AAW0SBX7_SCYPA
MKCVAESLTARSQNLLCNLLRVMGSLPSVITVTGTGVWQIKPRNNTVEEGRAVRLTCHMASLPVASYIWLKDDAALAVNKSS